MSWIRIISVLFFFLVKIQANRPNIIYIMADDMGYNDVGYSPYSGLETPVIDRLAGEGLNLKHSYMQRICTPSRAALMSGIYPFRYGLQRASYVDNTAGGLDLSLKILPQELKSLGYSTHAIGKWHLGYCNESYVPRSRGFDSFHGFYGGAENYYEHTKNKKYYDYHRDGEVLRNNIYSTDDFTNTAENIIRSSTSDSRPYFIYLSLQAPHAPLNIPPGVQLTFDEKKDDRLIFSHIMANVDSNIGKLVAAIEETDQWANTILIFTSDNGGSPSRGGNNYPLRGTKNTRWEGAFRVRTFLYGKGVPRGQYSGLFHVTDWYPTLISMAGGNGSKICGLDGVDQWSAIVNTADFDKQPRKSFIYNLDRYKYTNDAKCDINAAIRLRKKTRCGHVKDYKMMMGHTGRYSGRYNTSQVEQISTVVFDEPVLYDMTLPDELVEMEEAHDDDMLRETLAILDAELAIDREYPNGAQPQSEAAFHMLDHEGQHVYGPGWC